MKKITIYYLAVDQDGNAEYEETFEINVEIQLDENGHLDNQSYFEYLHKWGLENEEIVVSKVKDYLNNWHANDLFHCHFYIIGSNDNIVDLENDFFDFGDNSSFYFNL